MLKVKALTLEEKEDFVKSGAVAKNTNTIPWKEEGLYRPVKTTQVEHEATGSVDVELIPYYAWANRGLTYMDVWIPLAR